VAADQPHMLHGDRAAEGTSPVTGDVETLSAKISGYAGRAYAAGWLSVAVLFLNRHMADAASGITITLVIRTIASMTTSRKIQSCFYDFLIGYYSKRTTIPA
jgi:hypothetical protein